MKATQAIKNFAISLLLAAALGCDSSNDSQVAEQSDQEQNQTLQCTAEPGQCTRDINECGHASHCTCPEGYSYNGAVAECLYDFGAAVNDEQSTSNSFESPDDNSTQQCVLPPGDTCTRDINECGNPSQCSCPDGYEYNAAINKCLLILR